MRLILLAVGQSDGQFTAMPVNTYGVVGQNITLDCASSGLRLWYREGVPIGSTDNDKPIDDTKYAFRNSKNTLVIMSAALNDGVQFSCQDFLGSAYAYAQVIVLRK